MTYTFQSRQQMADMLTRPYGFAELGELDGYTVEALRAAHRVNENVRCEFPDRLLQRWLMRDHLGLPVAKDARNALASYLEDSELAALSDELVVGLRQCVFDHVFRDDITDDGFRAEIREAIRKCLEEASHRDSRSRLNLRFRTLLSGSLRQFRRLAAAPRRVLNWGLALALGIYT